jgi:hypothetical protein
MFAYTGLDPTTPLNVIVGSVNRKLHVEGITEVNWERLNIKTAMNALRQSLEEIHSKILDLKRAAQNRQMLKKTNSTAFEVMEGDYVLWSRVDENTHYPKLLVTWIGPFRVKECLPYSCVLEHVITGKEREAHHSRLKFYSDQYLDLTEEILDHVSNQGVTLAVGAIEAARHNPGTNRWELLVKWKGLEALESSWEPFLVMYGEVPLLVTRFIEQLKDEEQRRALLEVIALL